MPRKKLLHAVAKSKFKKMHQGGATCADIQKEMKSRLLLLFLFCKQPINEVLS